MKPFKHIQIPVEQEHHQVMSILIKLKKRVRDDDSLTELDRERIGEYIGRLDQRCAILRKIMKTKGVMS